MSYKDPGFKERVDLAAAARQKALDQLRAKPPVDEAVLAQRRENREAQEAEQAERRAARAAEKQQALAEKQAKIQEAAQAATALAERENLTDAQRKAARDARYAARKSRKAGGR